MSQNNVSLLKLSSFFYRFLTVADGEIHLMLIRNLSCHQAISFSHNVEADEEYGEVFLAEAPSAMIFINFSK